MENNSEERQVEQVELCGLEDFKISLEADHELGVEANERSVVAKLYTNKTVFMGLLRSILGRKWKLVKGWKLQEVEPKTFIIRLTKKQEALQISRNGPWPMCDGFLVVKPMPDDGKWSSADLNSSPVWVRAYEIPPRYWTIKNANALAQKIGSVISIDRLWKNGFPTNEYIRFQVTIQLNKPIMVRVFLPMEEGVCLWCYFKYENLPCVCYKCGVVGHEESRCRRKRRMIADDFNRTVPMYGPWIRLGSRKKDCFSDYELYEQERLERELRDVRLQAEARDNLIPGEENFEPALIGTDLHMEAVIEAARRQKEVEPEIGDSSKAPVEGFVAEGSPSSLEIRSLEEGQNGPVVVANVHGKDSSAGGEVVALKHTDGISGPSITHTSNGKGKELAEVEKHHVEHLAMVFKASLGPNSKPAHKLSRPLRSRKDLGLTAKSVSRKEIRPLQVGKKRRIDSCEEDLSILGSILPGVDSSNKKNCPEGSLKSLKSQESHSGSQGISEDGEGIGTADHSAENCNGIEENLGVDPWIVMGDLNSVLSSNEKVGGRPVTQAEGEGLRNFLFNHGAIDLVGVGALFTWTNGQDEDHIIKEKLDRVIVSPEWLTHFKKAGVRNLSIRHSDHTPVILDTRMEREFFSTPFRYLDAWSRDSSCRKVIEDSWKLGVEGFQSFILCQKLKITAKALCEWNRLVFRFCQSKIKALEKLLIEVNLWSGLWSSKDGVFCDSGDLNPMCKVDITAGDLMLNSGEGWDHNQLVIWLRPEAINRLEGVDFGTLLNEDKLYWKSSPDGSFSIKRAYWDLNRSRFFEKDAIGSRIWKLKMHERVKLFLWKLYQNSLPFGCKFREIFGSHPGLCMLCGESEGDTVSHFVANCAISRQLWFSSCWNIRITNFSLVSGKDIVSWLIDPPFAQVMSTEEKAKFSLFGAILYFKLWGVRNENYHNKTSMPYEMIQSMVMRSYREHINIMTRATVQEGINRGPAAIHWDLPRLGRMKCFVDFASDNDAGAVAGVIYDWEGSVKGFGAKKVTASSSFQGELEALALGVEMARSFAAVGVDFHSDNWQLVNSLSTGRCLWWNASFSFNKILRELDGFNCSVSWISRSFNASAHTLARWGLSHNCNGALRFWEVSPHVLTKLLFSA
ncbi:hypothetical protein F8388_020586 [Cannabis sativa]|uniref:CCHC-type domain-containing protein n=1 Tax=Cannabis sativa TaxID=3483 RepID=A0A7J6EPK0_CANSA|nr:hypothetical protein F8388_020586 [Cannabis sativa]